MLLAVIIASVMCRRISPIRSDKGEHLFLGLFSNPQFKHKCGIVPLTSSKKTETLIELSSTFHDLILPDALTGQCHDLSRQLKMQNVIFSKGGARNSPNE